MQRALQHSCNHLQYFSWCVLFPDAVHQNSLFFLLLNFIFPPFSPLLPPHRASRASINVRTANYSVVLCVARIRSTFLDFYSVGKTDSQRVEIRARKNFPRNSILRTNKIYVWTRNISEKKRWRDERVQSTVPLIKFQMVT